jgi:hypothetical protein
MIYCFIGLFAANSIISLLTGRGKNLDFTKKPGSKEQVMPHSNLLNLPMYNTTIPGRVRLAEGSPEV